MLAASANSRCPKVCRLGCTLDRRLPGNHLASSANELAASALEARRTRSQSQSDSPKQAAFARRCAERAACQNETCAAAGALCWQFQRRPSFCRCCKIYTDSRRRNSWCRMIQKSPERPLSSSEIGSRTYLASCYNFCGLYSHAICVRAPKLSVWFAFVLETIIKSQAAANKRDHMRCYIEKGPDTDSETQNRSECRRNPCPAGPSRQTAPG